jgi:phenylacetate-CoA ligase
VGRFDKAYARLPVWGQNAAITAFGAYWHWLRFGPGYRESVDAYRRREQLDPAGWKAYLQARTREVLTAAAEHVPYYRETWTPAQKRAAAAGNLFELPLTEKEPLRRSAESFLREDMVGVKRHVFHTSGSTGTPIASIWTSRELRDSLALREVRSINWAGASFREPRATFSGRMVEPDPASKGPYYRFNRIERQVYFSAFHLRPDSAPLYVEALRRHGIQWMTGYAVSYYLLAKFILEGGLKVPPLKAVVTTSEKLTAEMRVTMERAYGCRVYEEYSTVENAVFASECPHGRLHVSEDAGLIEILRADGSACAPGEAGEVVATCLMRDLQPLIRFRLGDMAVWSDEPCTCGRHMPVLKEVVGRIEDVVIGPDGRRLVRFHGIFTDQPHVREGQIVQESLERIRVKVVTSAGFNQADVDNIIGRVQQRVGTDIEVVVEPVDSIPRTKAGKFKAVVSLLQKQGRAEAETTGV